MLDRFECNRCHVIDGVEPATVNMDCRECHRQIITGVYPEPTEYLKMWDAGLTSMRDVPSLTAIDRRFTRQWFRQFINEPHDLRPRLSATMPRFALSDVKVDALIDELGLRGSADDVAWRGDVERGRLLLNTRGCGSCHAMSGLAEPLMASPIAADLEPDRLARATLLAPDLRHTRARFQRDQIVPWLMDPSKVKSDALMPALGLTEDEAYDAATFILSVPLSAATMVPTPRRLPVLDRQVRWKEVQTKLFDEICLHCHSDPKYNEGDGGPGNTGGLGYNGKGLDVSSYERAVRDRRFYVKAPDGTPKMVAHLMARYAERNGVYSPTLGMPLGFEPIDLQRIQLLETWIAQGLQE